MNQIVTNLDLSLKRERFRVSIRKQRLSELFNENRRKMSNLQPEVDQQEINFVNMLIQQMDMFREDDIENIVNCLSVGIKAFEDSQKSGHTFSLLWIKKIDLLISLSQYNPQIKQLSQTLILFTIFNNKDLIYHEAFDQENVIEFLKGNVFSKDVRLIEDALFTIVYLSEEKQIYRDIFNENNFEIIVHTIQVDKHCQLIEAILSSMQQALQNAMVISKEAAYKIFHPYLVEKYFVEEIHLRTLALRNITELIEKIEDSEQKNYVQHFMKTNTFKQILSQSKHNNITQLQTIKVCIICYGVDDIFDLELLDYLYNILSKHQSRNCNIVTHLRIMIYWALSNKAIMEHCISDLIHHKIFEFLTMNAYNETQTAQMEISYLYYNISQVGNAQHCSFIIQFNFIENVRIFLLSTQPGIEKIVTLTLINILQKLSEASDPNNELLVSFNSFKQSLEAKQIVEIISSSNQIDFDLKNSFDVFF